MAKRTESDRSVEVEMSRLLYGAVMTTGGRILVIAIGAVLMLIVAVGGQLYGRYLAARDMLSREETIQQLRSERQDLKAENTEQNAKINALQAKLAEVQAALDAIVPSENTYNIRPNQSLIVGDGRLTVGLIGSPTNQGVTININGKPQVLAAGELMNIALDAATTCQVRVQSFDMFVAALNASCAAVKPQ